MHNIKLLRELTEELTSNLMLSFASGLDRDENFVLNFQVESFSLFLFHHRLELFFYFFTVVKFFKGTYFVDFWNIFVWNFMIF